jgi:hypothetical protein
MSPGAAAAHRDFVTMAGDEGGWLYFDRFLSNGFGTAPLRSRLGIPDSMAGTGSGG